MCVCILLSCFSHCCLLCFDVLWAWQVRRETKHAELLMYMSPSLQSEVTFECTKEWLSRVWFLDGVSLEFLVQVDRTPVAAIPNSGPRNDPMIFALRDVLSWC